MAREFGRLDSDNLCGVACPSVPHGCFLSTVVPSDSSLPARKEIEAVNDPASQPACLSFPPSDVMDDTTGRVSGIRPPLNASTGRPRMQTLPFRLKELHLHGRVDRVIGRPGP